MDIPISVFLSHADEDKKTARMIANEMMKYGIDVFVAHDDIEIGADWKSILMEKISQCDVFVVLLTKNFHQARYTDHEVGMAVYLKKRIMPITFDKSSTYGFMSDSQAKPISEEIDPDELKNISDIIIAYSDEGKRQMDELIQGFKESQTYVESNAFARVIFQRRKFHPDQINALADAWISNDQISGATLGDCPRCLELFRNNWKILKPDYQAVLKAYMNYR